MGCANIHIDESTLEQIFIKSWKALMENKDVCVKTVSYTHLTLPTKRRV